MVDLPHPFTRKLTSASVRPRTVTQPDLSQSQPITRTVEVTPPSTRELISSRAYEQVSTVSGELSKHVALVRLYKPLTDLEIELFELGKAYKSLFYQRELTLSSLQTMFPLTQLLELQDARDQYPCIEAEIAAIIEKCPWELADYRWVQRTIGFVNVLAMKWDLVDAHKYRYRNTPMPIDPIAMQQYRLRQSWAFTVETIWFACKATSEPLRSKLTLEMVELAKMLQIKTLELVRFVASLNYGVNYDLHPDIQRDLGLNNEEERLYSLKQRPIKETTQLEREAQDQQEEIPEIVRALGQLVVENANRRRKARLPATRDAKKSRYQKSQEVGFHLLELPHILLTCLERDAFRANVKLRALLIAYEQLFRVFDGQITAWLTSGQSAESTSNRGHKRSNSNSGVSFFPNSE